VAKTDPAGDSLDARLADWEARLNRLESESPEQLPPEPEPVEEPDVEQDGPQHAGRGHLLFVPTPGGYELVEETGERPFLGDLLELDGREGRFAVTRIVRSPLPGDVRPCAYLEAI
jgi:hypothetical protein